MDLGMGLFNRTRYRWAVATVVGAEPRTPTERVARWLLAAAAVEFVALALTGLFLVFYYRPKADVSWFGAKGTNEAADVVRVGHRLASTAFILTLAALAIVAVALALSRSLPRRRHRLTAAAAVAGCVVGLFTSFTGFLLPWDQLALWAVTINTHAGGFRMALNTHQVQYVLVGGSAISVPTFRFWFYVHVLAAPALIIGAGYLALRGLMGRPEGGGERQLDAAAELLPYLGGSE